MTGQPITAQITTVSADDLRKQGAMISKSVSWERTVMNCLWQLANNDIIKHYLKEFLLCVTFGNDAVLEIRNENSEIQDPAVLYLADGSPEGTRTEPFSESCAAKYEIKIEHGTTQPPDTFILAGNPPEATALQDAIDYINNGTGRLSKLPKLKIGKLETIDRWEIEAYQNIKTMIQQYAAEEKPERPLSFAVFGTPGSGKSFGVKEIAKSVLGTDKKGDDIVKTLTFNVSQFTSVEDLTGAFHQVRDCIANNRLPLVFFDEFDAEDLKWLKFFLMPMWDSTFKDGAFERPLGKCILVFAGGVYSRFEDFAKEPDGKKTNKGGITPDEWKKLKVPDFISRLKGYLDIAGPNQRVSGDFNYILRRALVIAQKTKEIAVDESILRALLLVPKFKHGFRSLDTIFSMSDTRNGNLLPTELPCGRTMDIHTDDRKFTDILLLPTILNSHEGLMAKKIHEFFLGHLKPEDMGKKPSYVVWSELPIHFKLSNLAAARVYPERVKNLGGRIVWEEEDGELLDLTDKDEIERLAKAEHIRWMKEMIDDGWTPGSVRDDENKIHDCLYDWDELSKVHGEEKAENIRDKDRYPINEIPFVLAVVHKKVVKA